MAVRRMIRNKFDAWFTPKEFIIRSGDHVSYLRLSRELQMALGGCILLFATALTFLSLSSVTMTYFWRERGQLIHEMQLAYSGLVANLKDALPAGDKTKALEIIDQSTGKLPADFAAEMSQDKAKIVQLQEVIILLSDQLEKSEVALVAQNETSDTLAENIKELTARLDTKTAEHLAAKEQLGLTEKALSLTTIRRQEMEMAKNNAENELRLATQRLEDIRITHAGLVANLTERASSSAEEIEKIVSKTGLKPNELLALVDKSNFGQGGPYIPADDAKTDNASDVNQEQLIQQVATLDDQVAKMEKLQVLLRSLPLSAPVDRYYISSRFGVRADPFNGEYGRHAGMDMVGALGSDVLSTAPGNVIFAGVKGNYGNAVEIDHGFGIVTLYGHLKSISVKVGQEVGYREIIGLLGSTGRSSGPHVHYEIRYLDRAMNPDKFLEAGRYVFKS